MSHANLSHPAWGSALARPAPLSDRAGGIVRGLLALACWLSVSPVGAIEIHELEAEPTPHLGKSVIVQGRLQSAGGGRLKLIGSNVDCRYTESRVPIRPGTTHIELEGKLSREPGGVVLHIDSLRPIPDEAADFAVRRQKIPEGKFAALYELSRWARARARWYDDAKLRSLATSSYREAFHWEEEALAQQLDTPGLLELADRGEQLGLEADDVARLRYRALVLRRSNLRADDREAWESLAREIRARLPGADQPQEITHLQTTGKPVAELLREYGKTPANERNAVHRALGADAVVHLFGLRAGDSANLLELAREARQQVPDRPKVAAELELGGWRRAAARPDRLSREALEAARDGLIRLDHFDEAQSLVQRWLRARRERLPADEAEDRIQLAEEHLQLANDRVQAAELYREAWGLVPDFREAAAGLRQLGYELVGGQWREASEIGSPADEAEGFLRPGVSESDVVRRLRRPDRLTRTATRRGIIEQWNYAGPPALVIYLRRDVAGGSAVVTQVTHGD